MKILYVSHYDELLGANRSLLQLIIEVRKRGVQPMVLFSSRRNNSPFQKALDENSIPYTHADFRMFKHPSMAKVVPSFLWSRICNKTVSRYFQHEKIDLVHSNSSTIDIGKIIAKKIEAKHIWHLREFGDLDYDLKTPFGKWFQKVIYHGDSNFIAISNKIASHFSKYIDKDKLEVIYNGVYVPKKAKKPSPNGAIRFCIVGYLTPNKGQLEAVKAVDKLVNERLVKNFHLSIIGGGVSDYAKEINDYILRNRLSSYITLTGQRNDVPELLQGMDVGIMASYNEAFGRVTIEYMMNGLAVIASDSGANTEIITSEEFGLVFHSADVDQLANKMEYFITHPDRCAEIANAGQKYALKRFSSKANSDSIFEYYQRILSK